MVEIEFKILGKDWNVRILKKKKFLKKNHPDDLAVTRSWKRQIDIGPEGCDMETLVHELVHAYLAEMCLGTIELTADQTEEMCCELMAKRGRELLDLADNLMSRIQNEFKLLEVTP